MPRPVSKSAISSTPTPVATEMTTMASPDRAPASANRDALLQSIAAQQSVLMSPTVSLTLYVPTVQVGAVIGRKGQQIAQVQKAAAMVACTSQPVRVSVAAATTTTGGSVQPSSSPSPIPLSSHAINGGSNPVEHANMAVSSSSSSLPPPPPTYSALDWSDPAWTPVVIRADPCAALAAAARLQEVVGGPEATDQCVLDVPLSLSQHALVVGRRGQTLAQLSADTAVRIMVPHRELRHDVIQLEGDLNGVKQCLQQILLLCGSGGGNVPVAPAVVSPSGGGGAPHQQYPLPPKRNVATPPHNIPATTIEPSSSSQIPSSHYQAMVTVQQIPSQSKLRMVGRKTETSIKKKKKVSVTATSAHSTTTPDTTANSNTTEWQLIITGSKWEQVQAAAALLQKWNDDQEHRPGSALPSSDNNMNSTTTAPAGGRNETSESTAVAPSASPSPVSSSSMPRRGRGKWGSGGGSRHTPTPPQQPTSPPTQPPT